MPLSKMRRGDMPFYGGGGGIHHITVCLGDGQVIVAPRSGSSVPISRVRYGEIMPYATSRSPDQKETATERIQQHR